MLWYRLTTGGTGGRGAEFTKQVYLQLGQKEVEDQIQAAQFLAGKAI